ncbi:DNA-directed RNA polymerase III subunit RPC8 isoform X1 [Monodon monoceros]|uniref:DNA-directed RNA polymerase III subunit RPC8 isoform X1 n=1 Tax=Monodon monoceros TaxID=40151 RepID=UPI0010F96217|nr:DNA-directed RNA polymerase III subunit RPC8 isoform X1 [Monodon monoceros]
MFVLVEMVDTVRIPPWQFERKLNDSIAEELNKKLANKVVYNVGLCICLFDITKLEDAYVFPGDGASHTKVHFRYVVFHPFLDEVLIGSIKGCSPEGVHVSLGFFDDILIPPESLQQPAKLQSKCGCGSTRRRKERTTYTWTPARRSASGWWTRALWTRPPLGPAQPMPPLPARSCQRRRLRTRLWDPSVSRAWAFSPGGLAASTGALTLDPAQPSGRWCGGS